TARRVFLLLACVLWPGMVGAATIYPIDRAAILAGSRFDFKVEFDGRLAPADVTVTVNGAPVAQAFGRPAAFVTTEAGVDASAVLLRDVSLGAPGPYTVVASDGRTSTTVTWDVYRAAAPRRAKNVILFIGDGMSAAHRTAARILSRGIVEGKYRGRLAMDD